MEQMFDDPDTHGVPGVLDIWFATKYRDIFESDTKYYITKINNLSWHFYPSTINCNSTTKAVPKWGAAPHRGTKTA